MRGSVNEVNGFRVHAVSRNRCGHSPDGTIWHNSDLSVPGAAQDLIARLRPSHLLDLAWFTAPDRYRSAPENLDWLEASLALVKAFGEHDGERFVGVGSSRRRVASGPVRGGRHADPPYLSLRQMQSGGLDDHPGLRRALWLFRCLGVRVSCHTGLARRALQRLIPSLLAALSAGLISVTDGRQVRDFVYAPDAATTCSGRLLTKSDDGAYNVGTGRGVAVREVIQKVAEHLNARELVHFGAQTRRDDEPAALVADMATQ